MYEDIYRERFYPFRFCAETKQAFRQAVTVPALSMWSFQMVCGRGTTCIYQVVGHTGDGGDREVPPQLRMTWRNNTACRHTILWRPFKSGVPWTGGWKQEQVEMDLIPSHLERRQVKYRISTTSHPVGRSNWSLTCRAYMSSSTRLWFRLSRSKIYFSLYWLLLITAQDATSLVDDQ